jgi:hypothetical protein
MGSNESLNGPLPNDCDVDPRVVNHRLSVALFDLGVVDQLFDHFRNFFEHDVEFTLGQRIFNHAAVENLISNQDSFSNSNRLDIHTPVLLRHLCVEISLNFILDGGAQLHEGRSKISCLDGCNEFEGLVFRVSSGSEETSNVAAVFLAVKGSHLEHFSCDVVDGLVEGCVHTFLEIRVGDEVETGEDGSCLFKRLFHIF